MKIANEFDNLSGFVQSIDISRGRKLKKNTHTPERRARILARRVPSGDRLMAPSARKDRAAEREFDRIATRVSRTISRCAEGRPFDASRWALKPLYDRAATEAQRKRVEELAEARKDARRVAAGRLRMSDFQMILHEDEK